MLLSHAATFHSTMNNEHHTQPSEMKIKRLYSIHIPDPFSQLPGQPCPLQFVVQKFVKWKSSFHVASFPGSPAFRSLGAWERGYSFHAILLFQIANRIGLRMRLAFNKLPVSVLGTKLMWVHASFQASPILFFGLCSVFRTKMGTIWEC